MNRIYSLLLITLLIGSNLAFSQNLQFNLTSDSIVHSIQENTSFYASSLITNTSVTDTLSVEIIRTINELPKFWRSSICINICFPDFVDSAVVSIPPGGSQELKVYFLSSERNSSIAHVRLQIRDFTNPTALFTPNFYAYDISTYPTPEVEEPPTEVIASPNPFIEYTFLQMPDFLINATFTLYNSKGQQVLKMENLNDNYINLYIDNLPAGVYFGFINQESGQYKIKLVANR